MGGNGGEGSRDRGRPLRPGRSQKPAIISTAALVMLAEERNLIPACGPLLLVLHEQGYFLSDGVVAAVLAEAREG